MIAFLAHIFMNYLLIRCRFGEVAIITFVCIYQSTEETIQPTEPIKNTLSQRWYRLKGIEEEMKNENN